MGFSIDGAYLDQHGAPIAGAQATLQALWFPLTQHGTVLRAAPIVTHTQADGTYSLSAPGPFDYQPVGTPFLFTDPAGMQYVGTLPNVANGTHLTTDELVNSYNWQHVQPGTQLTPIKVIQAPPGMQFRDDYDLSGTTTYYPNDVTYYNGGTYIARVQSTDVAPTDLTVWKLLFQVQTAKHNVPGIGFSDVDPIPGSFSTFLSQANYPNGATRLSPSVPDHGSVHVDGGITADGALAGASLGVVGTINAASLGVTGAVSADSLATTHDATIGRNLGVTGTLTVANNATLQSNLGVTGTATLGAALVSGNALVGGALAVVGPSTLTGDVAAQGNASVTGTLGVAGATTLAGVTAGAVAASSLAVTNATTLSGTLSVAGAATLAGLTAGAVTVSSVAISGNQTVGGTMGINGALTAGASTLASLTASGNTSVGGTLAVTGTTTLAGLSAGASALFSASVTHDASVGGALTVTGAVSAGAAALASAAVAGNTSVGGTLNVTGVSTLGAINANAASVVTLAASSNTTIGGTLGVTGATALASLSAGATALTSLTVGTTAAISGAFSVVGATTLAGVTAGAISASGLTVSGATILSTTLNVTGATSLAATTVNGPLTLADGQNIILGGTAGSTIGLTGAKLGFFGATPVGRLSSTSDLRSGLIALGLFASGGATPLNLNGGVITADGSGLSNLGAGNFANQGGSMVLAGPNTGLAGAPTFRLLLAADIPTPAGDVAGTYAATSVTNLSHVTNGSIATAAIGDGVITAAKISASAGILGSQLAANAALADGQITSLSASKITGNHTLADVVLSANVPLINAASNSFTGNATIAGTVGITGALTAPTYDKGGAVYHIGAFGGSPSASGATNDAAYAAAYAAAGTGGKIVYGAGLYNFNSTIVINKQIILEGAGSSFSGSSPATVLKFPSSVAGILIQSINAASTSIRDLGVTGGSYNGTSLTGTGVDSGIEVHAPWVNLERITIANFGKHGLWINNLSGENSSHGIASQVDVVTCYGDGFHVRTDAITVNSNCWRFIGCGTNGCNGWGYFQSGGLFNIIINPRFQANNGNINWPVVSGFAITAVAGLNQPGLTITVPGGGTPASTATVAGTQHTLSSNVILTMPANQTTYVDWDGLGATAGNFALTTTGDPDSSHVRLASVVANATSITAINLATTATRQATVHPGGMWVRNDLNPNSNNSSTQILNPYVEGDGHGDVVLYHGGGLYDALVPYGSAGGNVICPSPQSWRITQNPANSGTFLTMGYGSLALYGSGVFTYPTLRISSGTFATGAGTDFTGTAEIGINLNTSVANTANHKYFSGQVNGVEKFNIMATGAMNALSFTGSGAGLTGLGATNFATQTANRILAGPTSGGSAGPTFRALVAGDIPGTLNATTVQSSGLALTVNQTGAAHIQEWWLNSAMVAQMLSNGTFQAPAHVSLATAIQGTSTTTGFSETRTPFQIYSNTTPVSSADIALTPGAAIQAALQFTAPVGANMPTGSVILKLQLDASSQPAPTDTVNVSIVNDNAGQPTGATVATGTAVPVQPLTTSGYTGITIKCTGGTLVAGSVYWVVITPTLTAGKTLHVQYDQSAAVATNVMTNTGGIWSVAAGASVSGIMQVQQTTNTALSLTTTGESIGISITTVTGNALSLTATSALALSCTSTSGTSIQGVSTTGVGGVFQSTSNAAITAQQSGTGIVSGFGSANPAAWIRRINNPASAYTGPMVKIDDTLSTGNSTGNGLEYWKANSLVFAISTAGTITTGALALAQNSLLVGNASGVSVALGTGSPVASAPTQMLGYAAANGVAYFTSPILHAGTHANGGTDQLTILANQTANTLLAGPASGANAAPAYRSLVGLDVPTAINIATQYGVKAISFDPAATVSSFTLTSGTPYVVKLWVADSFTCNTIAIYIQTAGSGLTANQNFVSLVNSSGTILFTTAAGAMDATFTGTSRQTISTGGIALTPGFYWVEILANGTTPPTLASLNSNSSAQTNFGLAGGASRAGTLPGSQTTIAGFTPQGTITASNRVALASLS